LHFFYVFYKYFAKIINYIYYWNYFYFSKYSKYSLEVKGIFISDLPVIQGCSKAWLAVYLSSGSINVNF